MAVWAGWAWAFLPCGIYFSAAWAWSTHLGFGLVAGFAGLTEPSSLVVAAFLTGLAAWRLARAGTQWVPPTLVASLALGVWISPWLIRDAVVFHRFIPIRDSIGLELWMGNNGYSERWTTSQKHPLHDGRELAAYNAGELLYMDQKAQQEREYIRDHPRWYAWMCARRGLYLWTGYWSFDKTYLAMEPTDPENVPFASCLTLLGLLWVGTGPEEPADGGDPLRWGAVSFLLFTTSLIPSPITCGRLIPCW